MSVTRQDVKALALATGWTPGTPMTDPQRKAFMTSLRDALTNAISTAPRVFDNDTGRGMTMNDAVRAMLEEFR